MSSKTFIKDLQDYFVDLELTEVDKRRIANIFDRHAIVASNAQTVYVDRIIDRTIKVPVYIDRERIIYVDSVTKKVLSNNEISRISATLQDVEQIIDEVCRVFGVTKSSITGKSHERRYAYPRFLFCHYLRNLGFTYVMIGRLINRDHTTIISAIKKSEDLILTDVQPYTKIWEAFNEQLKNKEVTN